MTSGDEIRACAALDDCHAAAPTLACDLSQPLVYFDPDWCVAVCGIALGKPDRDDDDDDEIGDGDDAEDDEEEDDDVWTVLLDQRGTRAHVTKMGFDTLTLRGARPLQRPPHATTASFRVIIEAYGDNKYCTIGFVPGDAEPVVGREICQHGGWFISVEPSRPRRLILSTSALEFLVRGDDGDDLAIPPVPPSSAVEMTVDYAAHTCCVAIYAPANARDFTALPEYVAELRFVPLEKYGCYPPRSDPTSPRSCAAPYPALHPAVGMRFGGGAICFLSEVPPLGEVK
jgi:hypothetical protein